ncbi:MAG: thioredoxin-disulfide reductase [Planctomycetota bacterium]
MKPAACRKTRPLQVGTCPHENGRDVLSRTTGKDIIMMDCDLAIIGGGPAGLSAALYAGRSDLKTILLERMLMGGQVALTMDIANYPGFPEGIDGPALAEKMRAQAERYGVVFLDREAVGLSQDGSTFLVTLKKDTIRAKTVIVATGSDPQKLGVPGESELRGKGVSYCGTCDAPFFRNKRVMVVGGGDSALKEALYIAKFASAVTLVHRRDAFRAEKFYRKQVLAHDRIAIRWNTVVRSIRGENKVQSVTLEDVKTGSREDVEMDGIFIFVGSIPNTQLLCRLMPDFCCNHVRTDLDMMTSIPGLFAVGDVREHSYRQVATAVGEGATAAMAAEHYLSRLTT